MKKNTINVLLVEDSLSYGQVMCGHLSTVTEMRVHTDWVKSLAEAHEFLRTHIPDVILLDLTLPDSDGIETVKAVARVAVETPIIVLTGLADEGLAMKALAAGARDYLHKSRFDAENIFRAIRYAISRGESDRKSILLVAALNVIPYGVVMTDADSKIQWCNPAFERLTGFTLADVHGYKPGKVLKLKPQNSDSKNSWKNYHFENGWIGEVAGQHKQKYPLSFDLTISPLANRLGIVEHFIVTLQDISERKRVDKMKKEFVSTVSHELRTPLTSISGALSLVTSKKLGEIPEKAHNMLSIAHKNSQRLTLLINDLLDMEKLLAGKMKFDMKMQCLLPLVEQAATENKSYADNYAVRYEIGGDARAAMVTVDAFRFQQVLNNFLSNAAKYSPKEGVVDIELNYNGDWLRMSVTDYGEGIPEEFKTRIFQKFSQADSSDTRQKGGTGLGLAISKELVERMGGRIGFESTQGKGSTFYTEFKVEEML